MFTDYLGACQSLSQMEHARSTYRLVFRDDDDEAADLGSCSFSGTVRDASGKVTNLLAWRVDGTDNEVGVQFPDLTKGTYEWEVMATDDSGASSRVVYGRLLVLSTGLKFNRDGSYTDRALLVRVPGTGMERLQAIWLASTMAETAAKQIEAMQGASDKAVADALEALNSAQSTINKTLTDSELALTKANSALNKLNGMDDMLVDFKQEIGKQVTLDPNTGCLIIGGVNSMVPLFGEAGHSPYVSTSGTWIYYKDETRQWVESGILAAGQDGHSPYLSPLGTWIEWRDGEWHDTGRCAVGKDGLDGSSVRRILVASEEDIPATGATCNGGFLYYVPFSDTFPRANITVGDARTAEDTLEIDGVVIDLSSLTGGTPEEAAIELSLLITEAEVEGVAVERVDGNIVALVTENPTLTLNLSGDYWVEEIPRPRPGYKVYAWVEQNDGVAGWRCVGLNNDIAASEVYGLVRIATDTPIGNGAPVGNNDAGQLYVPLAEYLTPGAVKAALNYRIQLENGGAVSTSPEGYMVAQTANNQRWGVMKHSTERTANVDCVGLMPDGRTGCTWASLTEGGVIKPGSKMKQLNEIPYQIGVGMDSSHTLCNNYLNEGAIKHMRPSAWVQAMPWVAELPEGTFDADSYYTGLHTSIQFGQNRENGLTLNPASTTLLAGVYIANGRDDARGDAVLTAEQTATFYYNKEQVYRREETYSQTEVDALLESLKTTLTHELQQWMNSHNFVKTSTLNSLLTGYVRTSGSVTELHALTPEEAAVLTHRDSTGLYLS